MTLFDQDKEKPSIIDYSEIIKIFPWIVERDKKCIISFDTDGWATGVLLTNKLNWNIVGYYDSERLILKKGIRTDDCVFVDVEIFRNTKKSVGHHLIMYDFNNLPNDFANRTQQCFNPNFIRRFDKRNYYTRKYPLGTYHLFDKILRHAGLESINTTTDDALSVIWFIDGLMNILYRYKPNVDEWVQYLEMQNLFWYTEANNRNENQVKELAQKFIAEVTEIEDYKTLKNLSHFVPENLTELINLISNKLQVENKLENWCLDNFRTINFDRRFMDLNYQRDFDSFWNANPFSMSTYFKNNISYTLEQPNLLP